MPYCEPGARHSTAPPPVPPPPRRPPRPPPNPTPQTPRRRAARPPPPPPVTPVHELPPVWILDHPVFAGDGVVLCESPTKLDSETHAALSSLAAALEPRPWTPHEYRLLYSHVIGLAGTSPLALEGAVPGRDGKQAYHVWL